MARSIAAVRNDKAKPTLASAAGQDMAKKPRKAAPVIVRHKDGSLWAKGQSIDGVQVGYWEWFRKDGTKLRSGHFDNGQQTGEWTTYDRAGKVYKVTTIKPKKA
jgi:antitoxin component YwqK of YwqJK toxin-antitoxin module